VFSGEGEVALALTEAILRRLGATPEQIDRERDRVRLDLAGGHPRGTDDSPLPLRPQPTRGPDPGDTHDPANRRT
jgi:CPA2 family monovalent cation:H+ antiporter-2